MPRKMYHAQEYRGTILEKPIICIRKDAWLGSGYYFWNEEEDAFDWGKNSKSKLNGKFQIYCAIIDKSAVLDTVFNEEHYNFWKEMITKAIFKLVKTNRYQTNCK